ncbi:Pyoverdine/dityrosine biosynthesis protein-domain-containing protein [Aspergillus pseudoustus]|uniref:Pyoverdine/dityrosine biosynthesis protein-domain-containing protein n=1 Tax=Aspergillus pseudoustus TaxID=1810923 RepID=A0ABR4KH23_9EURO
MPSINHGTSFYHHVAAMYLRDRSGALTLAEGRYSELVRVSWPYIRQSLSNTETSQPVDVPSGKTVNTVHTTKLPFKLQIDSPELPKHQPFQTHELVEPDSNVIHGLLLFEPSNNTTTDVYNWAKMFLVLNTRFLITRHPSTPDPEFLQVAERITNLFEKSLKNTSQDDAWFKGGGRQYFINKTYPFIRDKQRIQLCLPAFPCTSSNPLKVAGKEPDAAEYLALRHLHSFVEQVCEIYPQGATLWDIRHGHVFSDCTGVDDATVGSYGQILSATYFKIIPPNMKNYIQFKGLEDLFFSDPEATAAFSPSILKSGCIPQPIETIRTESAQSIDRAHLRESITQKYPETIKLYQGQSKFMLEDLSAHLANLSGTVRPAQTARSFDTVSASDERPEYDFQIPTPWHNSLVKVEGSDTVLLTRAEFARDAIDTELEDRKFQGRWCDDGEVKEMELATTTVRPVRSASMADILRHRWRVMGMLLWERIIGYWSAVQAAIWK